MNRATPHERRDATWLVALGAAVGGTDALLRLPLVGSYPAGGLRSRPASRATLAELAFLLTAALVGVLVLNGSLTATQWVGFAVVALAVTGLALHERFSTHQAVDTPDPVEEAVLMPA